MKKFNVVRPKKYTANGQEKTAWLPVGMITEFDGGGKILELNNSSEVYQIFEMKPKAETAPTPAPVANETDNEAINPESIPF